MSESSGVDEYRRAVVHLEGPAGSVIVGPASGLGRTNASFPSWIDGALYVITADNPRGVECADEFNAARRDELLAALDELGLGSWQADGGSRDRSYLERGRAITGVSREVVLDLCRRFEQDAIFEWTADSWSIVDHDGRTLHAEPWGMVLSVEVPL